MDTNIVYCGDNLEVLPKYMPDESVDLIYIDPPFNSSRNYEVFWGEAQERRAFEDRFGDAMTYVDWMRPRLREIYRVLKPMGSFYYHCDWHASHYVKVELDRTFGFNNFLSEVVWCYRERGISKRYWNRKHDTILFYAKDAGHHTFNCEEVLEPYSEVYKTKFKYRDEIGYYQIRGRNIKGSPVQRADGLTPEAEQKYPGLTYRQYMSKGMLPLDWWVMPLLNKAAHERLGYPTQKPLAILERIIKASSNEGDIVLDAFCGCGTTLEAAAKHNRKWIGIDFSPTACRVMAQRLENRLGLKEGVDFELRDMPKTAEQLRRMPAFEFQNWAVVALGGIPNKVKVGDYGIDGRLYLADIEKERRGDFMETLDRWYPIQVKQIDRVGRPDVDKFETAMRRDKRLRGFFIAFGFSQDAMREIKRANTSDGLDIVPVTVDEILKHERVATTITS